MNGKQDTTKSIILPAVKRVEHVFYCQEKLLFVRENSYFFLDQIKDIYETISPNNEYSHRETLSRET